MPSLSVHDLGTYLREQRESARLSVRQLSELAGVSNPYLSQIERGVKKPSAEILAQIAKGLRISAETLYVHAGILDERSTGDVVAAVLADPGLGERHKRILLDVYESFRAEHAAEVARPAATPARRTARKPPPKSPKSAKKTAAATKRSAPTTTTKSTTTRRSS